MTTSYSFRLSAAMLVVLTLPVFTSLLSRCAAQETGRGLDEPDVFQAAYRRQQAAYEKVRGRVLAAEVRALLMVRYVPDDAVELLKRVLDAVRNDPDLSELCRSRLHTHLQWTIWGLSEAGQLFKQLEIHRTYLRATCLVRLQRWQFQLDRLPGKE